jgi:hypothetical protein
LEGPLQRTIGFTLDARSPGKQKSIPRQRLSNFKCKKVARRTNEVNSLANIVVPQWLRREHQVPELQLHCPTISWQVLKITWFVSFELPTMDGFSMVFAISLISKMIPSIGRGWV